MLPVLHWRRAGRTSLGAVTLAAAGAVSAPGLAWAQAPSATRPAIVQPGNDVFLVWNRGWLSPGQGNTYNLTTQTDQIVLKVRWTFRP